MHEQHTWLDKLIMISGDNRYDYNGTLVLQIRQIKVKLQKLLPCNLNIAVKYILKQGNVLLYTPCAADCFECDSCTFEL